LLRAGWRPHFSKAKPVVEKRSALTSHSQETAFGVSQQPEKDTAQTTISANGYQNAAFSAFCRFLPSD
jgi:hypothetical protein